MRVSSTISALASEIVRPPYKLGNSELNAEEAAVILLSDDILAVQAFCDDNTILCSSQALWSALFECTFSGLHPLFLEVADALLRDEIEGVNPYPEKSYYRPLFWRDSYCASYAPKVVHRSV